MGGYKSRWRDPAAVLRERNLKAKEEADLVDLETQATQLQEDAGSAGNWQAMVAGMAASEAFNWAAGSLLAPMTMGAVNPLTLKALQGIAAVATTGGSALIGSGVRGHYQDKALSEGAITLDPSQTHLMGTLADIQSSMKSKLEGSRSVTAESIGKSVALSGALQLGGSVLGNIMGDSTIPAGGLASETNKFAIEGLEGLEDKIVRKFAEDKGGLTFVDKVDPTITNKVNFEDLTSEQIKDWAKQEVNKPTMDILKDRGGYNKMKDAWDMTNWDMAKNVIDWMVPGGKYGYTNQYGWPGGGRWKSAAKGGSKTWKNPEWLKGAGI